MFKTKPTCLNRVYVVLHKLVYRLCRARVSIIVLDHIIIINYVLIILHAPMKHEPEYCGLLFTCICMNRLPSHLLRVKSDINYRSLPTNVPNSYIFYYYITYIFYLHIHIYGCIYLLAYVTTIYMQTHGFI